MTFTIISTLKWFKPLNCVVYAVFSLDKLFWQMKQLEEWSTHLVIMAWSPLNSLLLSSELKLRGAMKHQQQHPSEGENFLSYYFICYNVKFFHVKIFPQHIFMKFSVSPVLSLFFSIPGWTNQPRVHRSYICSLYAHLGTLQPLSMSEVNVELLIQLLSLSIIFFHSSFLCVIFSL